MLQTLTGLPFSGPLCAALQHAQVLAGAVAPTMQVSGLTLAQPVQLRAPVQPGDDLELWRQTAGIWNRIGTVTVPGLGLRWATELQALEERHQLTQIRGRWTYTRTLPFF